MTELLGTVVAPPYLYVRNKVYTLRLRARGVKSDSITFSLRTTDKTVATRITKDILKRLDTFQSGEPSATWQQLRAHLDSIAPVCVAIAHGEAAMAENGHVPEGKQFEKVPVFQAPLFGIPVSTLRFSITMASGANKSGVPMLRTQGFEFTVGRNSSGTEVTALWYSIDGDLLTITQDSYPKDAPEERWDEMLTNVLEVDGCTKFQDRIAQAPPPGKQRDKWNALRMARVDDLLTSYVERLKLEERTQFIFKLAELTGPIESTLLKA
ncbi:hypothetical protein [Pseudomonas sp. BGI-2]|uniref:hypothetical protein n=1 Tax=Pseudomonas sp. BGI-2 TaxID=2528211 RepID=UPI001033591F|nr:hypothetical protein [Pseudomonas sp. BGI-2]TBN49852.1 hypothetical protein EYC95_04300 [Pseudomonas sp. BGI-2]